MSTHSQEKQSERQRSQEIIFETYKNNIQEQPSLTQTSAPSSQSSSSSSMDSETNERYLSQQIRTTEVTVNLIDCMECYVRTPRCTFEKQAWDFNGNTNTDIFQQVEEFRQEREQASQKQDKEENNETVQQKEDGITDDSNHNINDDDQMTSLLIVDLPWSQASQHISANDDHPANI
ncbi:unnamed protein product [Rotaria sp. Silwood2]|nr:unnamed protein product [Rotaria sp. Silwood2]